MEGLLGACAIMGGVPDDIDEETEELSYREDSRGMGKNWTFETSRDNVEDQTQELSGGEISKCRQAGV